MTWHKIEARNVSEVNGFSDEITINFGKFWKCGYYDWRLVSVSEDGKLVPLEIVGAPEPTFPSQQSSIYDDHDDYYEEDEGTKDIGSIAQGRFVVHTRGVKDQSFHEVQIDYQNADIDKSKNQFVRRGTFEDVENAIPSYAEQGINALYLMGTLERDNNPSYNKYSGETDFRKEDASPLASVDRSRISEMLGGEEGLRNIMSAAKKNNVKIIVDSLARISSSRHGQKYKSLLLNYLDEDGRIHIAYGTDGQAQKFEDTSMLNYRKLEAWEMLIDEVVSVA